MKKSEAQIDLEKALDAHWLGGTPDSKTIVVVGCGLGDIRGSFNAHVFGTKDHIEIIDVDEDRNKEFNDWVSYLRKLAFDVMDVAPLRLLEPLKVSDVLKSMPKQPREDLLGYLFQDILNDGSFAKKDQKRWEHYHYRDTLKKCRLHPVVTPNWKLKLILKRIYG